MTQSIFGILYHQGNSAWYALINATHPRQAVNALWEAHLRGDALLDASPTMAIERIEGIAQATDLPFPEAVPVQPAILAIIPLTRPT